MKLYGNIIKSMVQVNGKNVIQIFLCMYEGENKMVIGKKFLIDGGKNINIYIIMNL